MIGKIQPWLSDEAIHQLADQLSQLDLNSNTQRSHTENKSSYFGFDPEIHSQGNLNATHVATTDVAPLPNNPSVDLGSQLGSLPGVSHWFALTDNSTIIDQSSDLGHLHYIANSMLMVSKRKNLKFTYVKLCIQADQHLHLVTSIDKQALVIGLVSPQPLAGSTIQRVFDIVNR
jgi:hypothetical protein